MVKKTIDIHGFNLDTKQISELTRPLVGLHFVQMIEPENKRRNPICFRNQKEAVSFLQKHGIQKTLSWVKEAAYRENEAFVFWNEVFDFFMKNPTIKFTYFRYIDDMSMQRSKRVLLNLVNDEADQIAASSLMLAGRIAPVHLKAALAGLRAVQLPVVKYTTAIGALQRVVVGIQRS